jgi:hypothetical protein
MGTVTISGTSYTVIGTLAGATSWLQADPDIAALWLALSPNTQAQYLLKATRYFNSLRWKGTKTSSSQPNAWPRDGVVDGDGVAVADNSTPTEVEQAGYMLAGVLLANPAVLGGVGGGGTNQGSVREVSDGKASASFFYSAASVKATTSAMAALPRDVKEMIRGYLRKGASAGVQSEAFGTDGESIFDDAEDLFPLVGGL